MSEYRREFRDHAVTDFDGYAISPVIKFDAPGCADNCYTSVIEIPVVVNVTVDQLKQITDLRAAFVED